MKTDQASCSFRRAVLVAVPVLAAIFGGGCSAVFVAHPVGEKPHVLEIADWQGTWIGDQDPAKAMVVDPDNGRLEASVLQKENDVEALHHYKIEIRKTGDRLFGNVRDDGKHPELYVWGLVKMSPEIVVLWIPNVETFRQMVRDKKIAGTIDDGDVRLDSLSTEDLNALMAGKFGPAFEWESPIVFRRVAR
jgi:hypothetical protein